MDIKKILFKNNKNNVNNLESRHLYIEKKINIQNVNTYLPIAVFLKINYNKDNTSYLGSHQSLAEKKINIQNTNKSIPITFFLKKKYNKNIAADLGSNQSLIKKNINIQNTNKYLINGLFSKKKSSYLGNCQLFEKKINIQNAYNSFSIVLFLKKNIEFNFGGGQEYMGLKYHMEDAFIEKGINENANNCPPIAIFSKKYYNEICELNHEKIYDFCFIGSIDSNSQARQWVIDFAKKYFTHSSIFINTDNDPNWKLLGSFDFSNKNLGYCPKKMNDNQSRNVQYRVVKENIEYFERMCKSKYCLCPAGDSSWSFRFYEVLMCKSIPIVENWHHTYRTKEESNLNYKYILSQNIDININYDDYIIKNTQIFKNYHLLK
jgi:hypothetical protein